MSGWLGWVDWAAYDRCMIRGHHWFENASTYAQCMTCGWPPVQPLDYNWAIRTRMEASP